MIQTKAQNLAHSITAFFPCYNDGGTIASMVVLADNALKKITPDYEIIIIDDSSTDRSREVLRSLEQRFDHLKIIYHDKNSDYGGVLRSGFASATKDLIFYTDGDFQYDVAELAKLYAAFSDDVDVVNGYKTGRNDPIHRVFIGKIYQYLIKFAFNLKIKDVDCDFRLFRRSVFECVTLECNSGAICVEMVKKFQDAGVRFVEVPVNHYLRSYGKSQFFNFKRMYRVAIDLISLWKKLIIKRQGRLSVVPVNILPTSSKLKVQKEAQTSLSAAQSKVVSLNRKQ